MRRAVLSVAALAALTALVLPAGADGPAPHVTDAAGDANAVNGQGLAEVPAPGLPAQYAPADLLSVTYSTSFDTVPVGDDGVRHVVTGLQARVVTAAPVKSDGPTLLYRLNVDIGGCGGFVQYYENGPSSGPVDPKGVEFRQLASRGCPADATVRYPSWSVVKEGSTLLFDLRFAGLRPADQSFFRPGAFLSTRSAEVRTTVGAVAIQPTAPAVDIASGGTDFKIGSDVPKDVACTTGCPEA